MFCLWYEHEHRYEVIVLFISSNREPWSLSWSVLTSVATTRRYQQLCLIDISAQNQTLENLLLHAVSWGTPLIGSSRPLLLGNNVFSLQSRSWSVWWAGLWEMVSTRSCVNQTSISPHPRWSDNTSAVKPAQPTPIKPECSQNTFYSEIAHNESLAELFKIFTLQICLE